MVIGIGSAPLDPHPADAPARDRRDRAASATRSWPATPRACRRPPGRSSASSCCIWPLAPSPPPPRPQSQPLDLDWSFSVTGWLAVLLLFVLARVFDHGTRMRDDLEGTV